ncbi:hypothetical protein ACIA03_07950 [Nocardioides sp. NPDC051685]|uniref:hypothetical protein n=1 Tax=Nocardioides sp. NPDC051685 TaxID=3364334 RepID=UPI0037BC467D
MPLFVIKTNAVAGREDEFNDWYDRQHLPDVLDVPGFVAARRYRRSTAQFPGGKDETQEFEYLALYEIEGDPDVALKNLMKAVRDDGMDISPAKAAEQDVVVYDEIGDWQRV